MSPGSEWRSSTNDICKEIPTYYFKAGKQTLNENKTPVPRIVKWNEHGPLESGCKQEGLLFRRTFGQGDKINPIDLYEDSATGSGSLFATFHSSLSFSFP